MAQPEPDWLGRRLRVRRPGKTRGVAGGAGGLESLGWGESNRRGGALRGLDMRCSRTLALVLGILVPIAETVRRWSTWQQAPLALFDDYVLAALALYGAWLAGRDFRGGQCFLAAAWGIACGV